MFKYFSYFGYNKGFFIATEIIIYAGKRLRKNITESLILLNSQNMNNLFE